MIRWFISSVISRFAIILYVSLFAMKGMVFANPIDDVRATVNAWADAWKSQNIIRYMSFYSPTFRSEELDYQGWLNKKAERFQKPVNIQLEISDLWVFIEGKHATARFVQRYQDPSTADIGEKTLRLVNENEKWLIISESWIPLKPSAPSTEKRTTAAKPQVLESQRQTTVISNQKKKRRHANEIIVKNINFRIENDYEEICLHLNAFTIPVVLTLENKKPRIVIDITNVYDWKGAYKTPVNGRLIKQIRTYLHRKIHKLRIVLDLNPAEDYIIDQSYDPTEYSYCIEIK